MLAHQAQHSFFMKYNKALHKSATGCAELDVFMLFIGANFAVVPILIKIIKLKLVRIMKFVYST